MATVTVAGPTPPPFNLPDPDKPDPGPSKHPPLPGACTAGQIFGVPNTPSTSGNSN